MKKTALMLLCIIVLFQLKAQISVNTNADPDEAINDILLGKGIIINSSSIDATTGSWGTYNTASNPTQLGINEGIIMTNGSVLYLNQNPVYNSDVNNGDTSSLELESMIQGHSTFDQCAFDIDFTPLFDSIEIKYVFASEEYNEMVDSSFSDAFAFFISGLNPQGGNYSNHNFATVELYAAQNPVNVTSINNGSINSGPCVNCDLFRNSIPELVYDGLTVVLTAKVAVVRNTNYHLKIVIADLENRYKDSGLFLEANSFRSICDTTYYTDHYVTLCPGDVYNFNGHTYDYSDTFFDTLTSTLGCDSIILTHLNMPYIQSYFSTTSQQGNQITLSNQSNGVNYSFIWDFGDGTFVYQNHLDTVSHYYANSGYYEICLSVIDTITSCFRKQCSSVSINTTPNDCDAQFYYNISSDTVYFYSTFSQGLITDYFWVFETGETSHEANPYIIFPSSGYFSAKLQIFNSVSGCFSEKEQYVYYGNYLLDCKSDFNYFPVANDNSVIFSNLSIGNSLDYYIWDFGDGTYSNLKNPTHEYTSPGIYDVCLSISSSSNNCVHTKCNQIISGNLNNTCRAEITTFPPSEILNPTNIPVNIIGSIYSSQETSAFSLLWDFGDANILENQMSVIHTYTETGIYLVHFNITSSECFDDVFKIVNLSSENQLKVMFGAIPMDESEKDEGDKPVKFKGVTMGEPSRFNWDFGDGETDTTSMFPVHEFAPNITHNVCLTVFNTKTNQTDTYCKDVLILDTLASIVEIKENITINSYPNPTNGFLNIDLTLYQSGNIEISIYDLKGIKQDEILNEYVKNGYHHLKVTTTDWAKGIYFISIQTKKSIIMKKIVIN